MAGCGYVCPLCEGTGYGSNALPCEYCSNENDSRAREKPTNESIVKLQEGPCSDLDNSNN